jgi:hypothetical protein
MDALARVDALGRALDKGAFGLAERLLAGFREKERELVAPYAECKLAKDKAGAAHHRQRLADCLTLERGDLPEVREFERRTGRRVIGHVPAPPTRVRVRPVRALRGPRRRGAGRPARRRTSRSTSRARPEDGDSEPAGPGAPVGDTRAELLETARAPVGGPCLELFQRPGPLERPEKGERR